MKGGESATNPDATGGLLGGMATVADCEAMGLLTALEAHEMVALFINSMAARQVARQASQVWDRNHSGRTWVPQSTF